MLIEKTTLQNKIHSFAYRHTCSVYTHRYIYKFGILSFFMFYIALLFTFTHTHWVILIFSSFQFWSSVAQSCPTLCDPMNHSTPGLPVHHQFPESNQTQVHWVGDAIQPSYPLSSPSPPALNLSQHQGLFKRGSSSHQVAKGLKFQLQHQSFQWTPRTELL